MTVPEKFRNPSVFACAKSNVPSSALFESCIYADRAKEDKRAKIPVTPKTVRGTIFNRAADAKGKSSEANIQTVDEASLPHDADTLAVTYTVRVLDFQKNFVAACNDPAYQDRLKLVVEGYIAEHGFEEIATATAINIVNGRALWRNLIGALDAEVVVYTSQGQTLVFDPFDFSIRNFDSKGSDPKALEVLKDDIVSGLKGDRSVCLKVVMFVRLGMGQEVYPSQNFIQGRSTKKGAKSKELYSIGGTAAFTSQKIGNALRTIDIWHPEASEVGPIPVEPFGAVTTAGKVYRSSGSKVDFYSLLDNWVLRGKAPDVEQRHYVIANLIRGGVFSEKDRTKKTKDEAQKEG
jgi:CRISPR-associated protein Csy3